ncbi:Hypothetical predicted protein [Mytilus galloprovincialis]|uniref:DUF1758 domain-containing protein n=1 Tax=Mytilus galloprovincialis TaxID=29158 RepID=A0A8B6DVU9_MYTGA|nr:Hypothetical predicted protein [Mytilus galloprovincialis]
MDAGKTSEQLEPPTATAAFLTNTNSSNRNRGNKNTNASNTKPKPHCAYCTIQHNAEEPDTVLHSQSPDRVLLKTAINPVSAEHEILDAKILFDEGAQRSFITEELAEKLKLKPTGTESVNLSGFGDNANSTKIRHLRTGLVYLITTDGKLPIRVLIVPEIAAPMRTYVRQAAKLTYLSGIKLAHPVTADENFEISILIGADYFWSIVQNDIIRGEGPTAVQSKIGYLLSGTLHSHNSDTDGYKRASMMNVMIATKTDEYDLEKFWKIESLATEKIDTTKLEEQIDIQKTYEEKQIRYHDNRYFVTLPWKEDHPTLPTNKAIAQRRTENVVRRLSKEPKLLEKYGEIMAEQEKRGFIEKVDTTNETDETRAKYTIFRIML